MSTPPSRSERSEEPASSLPPQRSEEPASAVQPQPTTEATPPPRRIAIIGDGRMGRAAADLATARGWTITAQLSRLDNPHGAGITRARLDHPDAIVEFTEPSSAVPNMLAAIAAGIPIVCGTSGWYDALPAVRAAVASANGSLFWAANFSVGASLLSAIAREAGRRLRDHPGFATHIVDVHHALKRDAPSGTAIVLEQSLRDGLGKPTPISSIRVGAVPGEHTVIIDGAFEQLTLRHEARDRRVFAEGALIAADWLVGRTGVYTMTDLLP